ncbi:MAG TPA: DUF2442 domain-containing protein [Acidobacteriaceae bacterium]|nr:DUF2442 domain-containing protein [Acidobacteriaceae bacterium]
MPANNLITDEEFKAATERARARRASTPHAIAAYYDRKTRNIIVKLSSGVGLFFSPEDAQGLEKATTAQLNEIEISASGFGLHWPQLDADLYVPGLLEGLMGSAKWMAARLGARGGKSRSGPKRAAARANGSLGGRPRKLTAR